MGKNKKRRIFEMFVRYFLLIIIAFPNLYLFYFIFTPLTIYPLYLLFSLFYNVAIEGAFIFINNIPIEIIDACIAGSAYYLLTVLNLAVKMPFKKRIFSLICSYIAFLIINIIRIFILSVMYVNNLASFEITHKLFWYVLSTIFVVVIWFSCVYIFKIKEIPVYEDIKYLVTRRS